MKRKRRKSIMLKKKKLPLREFQDRFWTEERCRNKSGREALAGGLCLSKG